MTRLLAPLVVVVLVLVSACAGTDSRSGAGPRQPAAASAQPDTTGAPTASAPTDSALQPVRRGEARRAVRRGLDVVATEPTTTFRYDATADGEGVLRVEGRYTVDGWVARAGTPVAGGGDDLESVALVRSADGAVYLQLPDQPAPQTGCWLELGSTEVPLGVFGLRPDEPGYVSVLGGLRARGFDRGDPTVVLADLDLGRATLLLSGRVFEDPQQAAGALAGGAVPVRVGVADGRIARLEMRGSDVHRALREAGVAVTEEAVPVLLQLDFSVDYTVRPAELADLGLVGAPRPDLVVTRETAADGCSA